MKDWIKTIIDFAERVIAPLLFFLMGVNDERKRRTTEQNKVLQEQRDNDITSLDDADSYWRMREDDK